MSHIINNMREREAISYNFDRLGWLQRTEYLQRRILFLDLNHWINLSKEQDNVHRELNKVLKKAVDEGEIICPVSPSVLMELQKQRQTDTRNKCSLLMDSLSGRLSLRVEQAIFAQEFRAQLLGQRIERQVAYSFFIDAMSSGSRLEFPEGWTKALAGEAARQAFERITSLSIPMTVNILTEEQRERNIGHLRKGWTELAQEAGEWRGQNEQVSAAEIEQAEFASTVDALVPSAAKILLEEADHEIVTRLLSPSTTSEDEKREMLRSCPIFWCRYKLLAGVRLHKKTLKENDLWDLQHVITAAPYVDCLACDKGTRQISTQTVRIDEKYGTRIVSKAAEILEWVQS